jgi:LppX_LprAFG lipoprotein
MTRLRSSGLAFVAILALAVVACGGAPAGPVLTDPTEIITAALQASEGATSVHVDVTVDGVVPVTLPGGSSSTEVNLTGTTASADADLANGEAHATFSVPGVLGLAGELIQADGKTYVKSTLTGSKYRVVDAGSTLPVDPTNTTGMIDNLGDFLLKPGVDPVKGDDVACGSSQCYTINVDLTAEELASIVGDGASSLPVDLTGATLQMTIRVEQGAPNHLAGISITLGLPGDKTVNAEVTFSKWDEPVTITAPPADQIAVG